MSVDGAPAGLLNDWHAEGKGANKGIGVLLVHGFTGSPASMRPWGVLLQSCEKVFICGLSMGGGTVLNVATRYSRQLAGIILVNPMIHVKFVPHQLAWVISRFQKMRDSVGDDIKRPGITEWGYDSLPALGVHQLLKMLSYTRKRLHDVTAPLQLFHSVDDHTLPVSNTEIIMAGVGSREKNRIELVNSYHVATLDYDQEIIFENSRLFIQSHS